MKLFTIGYGGRTPQQLADMLTEHGVSVLVDVRAYAGSRVPGFSKRSLAQFMEAQGIEYLHLKELGNLNRKAGPGAAVALLDEETGLQKLTEVLERQPAAIMCACRSHRDCHRLAVSTKLRDRVPDLFVEHLF